MPGADALTLLGLFNPRELGAGGDGIMDDAVGIKAAIGGANQVGGGIVWIPPGTYRLASSPSFSGASNVSVLVAPGVSFTGSGSMPAASGSNGYFGLGSLPATLGYNLTGTQPAAAATGVAGGTFFSVIAPNGGNATSGAPGSGGAMAFTLGAAGTGGTGNANGGDATWTMGAGIGTGRNSRVVINSTQVSTGTSNNNGALTVNATWSPVGGSANSMQAISAILTTTAGTGITGPSVAAIEMQHLYTGSDACTQLLYGSESTFDQQGTGALTNVTGFQGNVRATTGTGAISTASGIDTTAGQFACNVGTLRGFQVGSGDQTGAGVVTAVIGYSSTLLFGMGSGTYATGGLSVFGAQFSIPSQGGNTAGIDTNIGLRVTGQLSGAGTGQPGGASGTVNNYGVWLDVPAGVANGGTTNNYGLRITGNGSATASLNYAIYYDGTAQSVIAGPITLGVNSNPSTANVVNVAGSPAATTGVQNILRLHGTITSSNTQLNAELQVQVVTSAAATGTMYGVSVIAPSLAAAVTTVMGGLIANQGSASTTNAVGWNVAPQSGATNNINLMLGTTLPTGTWNIYSDSASNSAILGSLAIGSNTAAVGTGALAVEGVLARYNAVATAGYGTSVIRASGRPATQTNTTVTITSYANPATDASYEIRVNVNVTVSTTVTMTVTCTYTDEANVARTLTIPFLLLAGTLVQSITTAQGNIAYESVPITIRAKASTTISLQTAGTVTAVTYTTEGRIVQVA